MTEFLVGHRQLEYAGILAEPLPSVWSDPRALARGLFHAFAGLHEGLSSFWIEENPHNPLEQVLVADLKENGRFRLAADRVELAARDFTRADVEFAETVERGTTWLRSAASGVAFQAHYVTISLDGVLSQGTSVDFLTRLVPLKMPGIGENLGTGLIFHSSFPQENWQVHLTLDHSSRIEHGLAVQLRILAGADEINPRATLQWGVMVTRHALGSCGLVLSEGVG